VVALLHQLLRREAALLVAEVATTRVILKVEDGKTGEVGVTEVSLKPVVLN
tara:strand:- start:1173 stop:1325 length:153 start_codon:yes stop_codon:yes gene_type:complete